MSINILKDFIEFAKMLDIELTYTNLKSYYRYKKEDIGNIFDLQIK